MRQAPRVERDQVGMARRDLAFGEGPTQRLFPRGRRGPIGGQAGFQPIPSQKPEFPAQFALIRGAIAIAGVENRASVEPRADAAK